MGAAVAELAEPSGWVLVQFLMSRPFGNLLTCTELGPGDLASARNGWSSCHLGKASSLAMHATAEKVTAASPGVISPKGPRVLEL